MPNHRLERINELLKHEIGEIVRRELPLGDAGLVSVNKLEVAGDLRSAKVFVSCLGGADQQKRALRLLDEKRVRIQGMIGRSVILKYTPTLVFLQDDTIEKGNRVLHLLEELERTMPASEPLPPAPDEAASQGH